MPNSHSSSVIVVTSTRTTLRPGRLTESLNISLEDSLIRFLTNPPARFPTEFPMDSPASSSGTSHSGSGAKFPLEDNPYETFSCSLCLYPLKNTDSHNLASLKCGHIFGENCLIRWFKVGNNSDVRRCPICNQKANLEDIRVLYTKKLKAVVLSEINALELDCKQVNLATKLIKKKVEMWRMKTSLMNNEVERLKNIVPKELYSEASTSDPVTPPLFLKKIIVCKNLSNRVMTFNKNNFMLVMSQYSNVTKLNSYVIRKVDASLPERLNEFICVHSKQIRDMVFHPLEHNHLASVGLDKCISLTDIRINKMISSITAPEPLWSCCWSGDNTNVLLVGDESGTIHGIDRRIMKLFSSTKLQNSGCVSLNPIPPSNFRSFSNGGVLKTRIDSVSILEKSEMSHHSCKYQNNILPLKGRWKSSSYDCQSNLILTSAVPYGSDKMIRHVVSKLTIDTNKPMIPVIEIYGGDKSTKVSRPCLIPKEEYNDDSLMCFYEEATSTIKLSNITKKENIYSIKVDEHFVDLCPLSGLVINGRRAVAGLSENAVSFFSV